MSLQKADVLDLRGVEALEDFFNEREVDLDPDEIFVRVLFSATKQVFPCPESDLDKDRRLTAKFLVPVNGARPVEIRNKEFIWILF